MNKMKKNFLMFAALVVSVVISFTMTACSSSDEADLVATEETGVVKAEFTISFPQQIVGATRMAEDVVQGQASPVFRGISSIELRPFSFIESDISTSTVLTSPITLQGGASVGPQGASATDANIIVGGNDALYTTSKSHLYKDVSIAIGTRSFLFYGIATDKAAPADVSGYAINGSLVPNQTTPTGTLADISFSPQPIATNEINSEATTIANYLTSIATTSATVGSETKTMLDYFPNFKNLTAGSWNSVKAVVKIVYTSIKDNTDALSVAIKNAILVAATADNTEILKFDKGDYKNLSYPANIQLPDGAAYVKWDNNNNKFEPLANDNSMNIGELGKYSYPASLYYWGLSNIKTTSSTMNSKYTNEKSWDQILEEYDAAADPNTVVQSTTRSIAIQKPVEYAVGRLDVTVNTDNGKTELQDLGTYNGATSIVNTPTPASPQNIVIGTNFPITGILISNQKAVDYKFETIGTASYTVYDSQIEAGCYLNSGSNTPKATHTLVLQTPVADPTKTTDEQMKSDNFANVKIAVEFQNNSDKTIVGKSGCLIYPGTKFYMIGTLMPGKNGSNTDDPKYKRNPFVTSVNGGSTIPKAGDYIKQAFVQDYVTKANFTVKSFQNAYNMLPDLRTPELEIGLSVDLTWEDGIVSNIVID